MAEPLINDTEVPYNNLDYLKDLLGHEPVAIQEIISEIKLQWFADKQELSTALEAQNSLEVKRLLHRMKSTFSPLGPGHMLYKTVLEKGEMYLSAERNISGDEAYWQEFVLLLDNGVNKLSIDN